VIVCGACDARNEDDAAFCTNCREPLEFTGVVVEDAETAPDAEAVVAEVRGDGSSAPADAVATPQPAAILPAPEVQRRAATARPRPAPDEPAGGLVCSACGTGNAPSANFCRRCGTAFAEAVAKPPWWRRLFRRPRKPAAAGERRARRTRSGEPGTYWKARSGAFSALRLLVILSALGVGVGALTVWRGNAADAYDWARGLVLPRYETVLPARVTASSRVPGHPGADAFDRNLATFWAEGAAGNGPLQKLVARFDRPIDVARIGITAGRPSDVVNQPTPRRLRLRGFDGNGRLIAQKIVTLRQTDAFQRFDFSAADATRLAITIVAVYPSRRGHAASLTEVELFEKT
jgi:ribosomal protein L40E